MKSLFRNKHKSRAENIGKIYWEHPTNFPYSPRFWNNASDSAFNLVTPYWEATPVINVKFAEPLGDLKQKLVSIKQLRRVSKYTRLRHETRDWKCMRRLQSGIAFFVLRCLASATRTYAHPIHRQFVNSDVVRPTNNVANVSRRRSSWCWRREASGRATTRFWLDQSLSASPRRDGLPSRESSEQRHANRASTRRFMQRDVTGQTICRLTGHRESRGTAITILVRNDHSRPVPSNLHCGHSIAPLLRVTTRLFRWLLHCHSPLTSHI